MFWLNIVLILMYMWGLRTSHGLQLACMQLSESNLKLMNMQVQMQFLNDVASW